MKLVEHTYQVSYHPPVVSPIDDTVDGATAQPKHARVRATNAQDAIDDVVTMLVTAANLPIEDDVERFGESRLDPAMLDFFANRPENRFNARDFPVLEVKVVA